MRRAGGAWLEMLEVGGGRLWEGKLEVGGRSAWLRWTMGSGLLLLLLPFLSWRGAEEEERRGGWR